MIDSKDISVIIQGPIYPEFTGASIRSIRKHLPDSQIILSTWQGSNVTEYEYDCLVLSEDPGGTISDHTTGAINNINRQLISTCAGIRQANRKYCLKFRSDMELLSPAFLNYFGRYDQDSPAQLFNHRVLLCNYFCRNPRIMPLPFHLTDWIAFGLLEDIREYYDVPLQTEREGDWFSYAQKHSNLFANFLCRFTPEQYICCNYVKKHQEIHCDNYYDCTRESIVETEKIVAQNFVILDYQKQLDVLFPKYNPNRYFEKYTLYSFEDWKILYHYYCLQKGTIRYIYFTLKSRLQGVRNCGRRILIKLLDKLALKEKVKHILRKKGYVYGK